MLLDPPLSAFPPDDPWRLAAAALRITSWRDFPLDPENPIKPPGWSQQDFVRALKALQPLPSWNDCAWETWIASALSIHLNPSCTLQRAAVSNHPFLPPWDRVLLLDMCWPLVPARWFDFLVGYKPLPPEGLSAACAWRAGWQVHLQQWIGHKPAQDYLLARGYPLEPPLLHPPEDTLSGLKASPLFPSRPPPPPRCPQQSSFRLPRRRV